MLEAFLSSSLGGTLSEIGQDLLNWMDDHGARVLLIVVIAWLVRHFSGNVVARILAQTIRADLYPTKSDRDKRVKTLNTLAHAVMRFGVYLIAGILIIGEFYPHAVNILLAGASLATVALGFGAKDLINDFIRGIFIISENQYRVGDFVEIAEVSGTVEAVTIRTTILRDLDGNVHHVPNGAIIVTTNKTIGFSRLNEDIILAQGTDLALVEHLINHAGEELAADPDYKNKVQKPPKFAGLNGYLQGGVSVKITGKVSASDKFGVKSAFYQLLDKAFSKHDIHIISFPLPAPTGDKKK